MTTSAKHGADRASLLATVPEGAHPVLEALSTSLIRRIRVDTERITRRFVLSLDVVPGLPEPAFVTGATLDTIAGCMDVRVGYFLYTLVLDSLAFADDLTGRFRAQTLRTSRGDTVERVAWVCGDVAQAAVRTSDGHDASVFVSSAMHDGMVEMLDNLCTIDGRRIGHIESYHPESGAIQVREEGVLKIVRDLGGSTSTSLHSGDAFWVSDRLSADRKLIPIEPPKKHASHDESRTVRTVDGRTANDVKRFSGLPGAIGTIFNRNEPYRREGDQVFLMPATDELYRVAEPMRTPDGQVVTGARLALDGRFVSVGVARGGDALWAKPGLGPDGALRMVRLTADAAAYEVASIRDTDFPGYYDASVRPVDSVHGSSQNVIVTGLDGDGACQILRTRSGHRVLDIKPLRTVDGLYLLRSHGDTETVARLERGKFRELPAAESRAIVRALNYSGGSSFDRWSHEVDPRTGEVRAPRKP